MEAAFPVPRVLPRPLPSSSRMARTNSSCVMGRPRPRSEPSTSRRYRIFSPSFTGPPSRCIPDSNIYIAICDYCQELYVEQLQGLTELGPQLREKRVSPLGMTGAFFLESGFDAGAGVEIVAQGVADEVEAQHGEHDGERGKQDEMRGVEQVSAAVVEHGSPAG